MGRHFDSEIEMVGYGSDFWERWGVGITAPANRGALMVTTCSIWLGIVVTSGDLRNVQGSIDSCTET